MISKLVKKLKLDLLELGEKVSSSLEHSVTAVKSCDAALAKKVIEGDSIIDSMEVAIEEACLEVLARHQPVAKDLRNIIAILKINNDLERVGDLSGNIAKRVLSMNQADVHFEEFYFDFDLMSQKAQEILKKSLNAFSKKSLEEAKEVLLMDNDVDVLHSTLARKIFLAFPKKDIQTENYVLSLTVAKFLERIADHATNIAEDTIYVLEGKIVRHS